MKRSSARRARRWIIQELIRSLDRLSDTTASVALSGYGHFPTSGKEASFSGS